MANAIKNRRAARAVFLTPDHRILLVQMQEPRSGLKHWATPGGGIESGEDFATALRREICEETSLTDYEIGPQIWDRTSVFTWDGHTYNSHETYHLIRIAPFEPRLTTIDPEEIEAFCQFAWWTAAEIAASDDHFVPADLGQYLQTLVRDGIPDTPIDIGV